MSKSKKPTLRLLKDPTKTSAFIAKAERESKKLESKLVESLKDDLRRALDDEILPDVKLRCGHASCLCHQAILKMRMPELDFANQNELYQMSKEVECNISELDWSSENLKDFLLMIYKSDLLDDSTVEAFQKAVANVDKASTQEMKTDEHCPLEAQSNRLEPEENNSFQKQQRNKEELLSERELTLGQDQTEEMLTCWSASGQCSDKKKNFNEDSKQPNPSSCNSFQEESEIENGAKIYCDAKEVIEVSRPNVDSIVDRTNCLDLDSPHNNENQNSNLESNTIIDVHPVKIESLWLQDQLPKVEGLKTDLVDLLLSGRDADITIRLDGDSFIMAHRVVLACRCSYFEAMLSGSWRESEAQEISYPGVSYESMVYILAFIYGGVPVFPPTSNLREIFMFSEMTGLSGIMESVELSLHQHYCHFFHKPCPGCLSGVIESLHLATQSSSLTSFKESCLSWMTQHIARSWSQKLFSSLPPDIQGICYDHAKNEVTIEKAIHILEEVDKLRRNLPTIKWADPVRTLALKLYDEILNFVSERFPQVALRPSFISLFKGLGGSTDILDNIFKRIDVHLSSQTAPSVFLTISRLENMDDYRMWNEDAIDALTNLRSKCTNFIIRNMSAVQHSHDWLKIPIDFRQQWKKDAVFVDDRGPQRAKPVLSSSRRSKKTSNSTKPS